jgi:AcrR family transcriptional regulator
MTGTAKSKPPVAVTQQSRSQQTQAAILGVVEKRLRDGSFDQTSVQDIVSEAGCSVGAFYGRFANKAAALFRFHDDNCTKLEEQVSEVLDPTRSASLATLLDEFVATIVNRTFSSAAILRAKTLQATTDDDSPFINRTREMNDHVQKAIKRCLIARKKEHTKTPSDETALFVLALVGGLSRDAVLNGARLVKRPGKLDARRFKRELNHAVQGYLGVQRAG